MDAEQQTARAREIKERHGSRLMDYPNVTGVGVGLRVVGGERRDEACVRVYVRRKLSAEELEDDELLPASLEGVPVDVVEGEFDRMQHGVGPLPLAERTARQFPFLPPGVSVGGLRVTAGTLGAAAYDAATGTQLALSNWHVLCGHPDCTPGETIVQPGPVDGGTAPGDAIGSLARFADTDRVDAAVAVVSGRRFLLDAIAGIGPPTGAGTATLGMRVRKSGRTTGVTTGIVDDVSADIELIDGSRFVGQISVVGEEEADVVVGGGDSGSLVVDERRRGVGLLFAGRLDGTRLFANPIGEVTAALGIRLAPVPSPLHTTGLLAATV